jgi:hypothetical protein
VFPAEIYRVPRIWGEQSFPNLIYWNEVEKGGHFAAWEYLYVAADDVQSMVISGVGHWVAEEGLEELLTALTEFLAPYRDGEAAAHESHERSVDT